MTLAPPSPVAPRAGLAFVIVTLFLDILGIGIMIPILPQLVTDMNGGNISAGSTAFGAVMATYTTMLFFFSPIQGALSDQYGRKPLLFLSLSGTALAYALMVLAPNIIWIFIAQIMNGVTGASITVCSAYIADVSPPQERSKNFALIGATFGVGLIVGPALGGVMSTLGLRAPFVLAGALSALNLLYGVFVLPESHDLAHRHPFAWSRANPIASFKLLGQTPYMFGLATILLFTNLGLQALRSTWVLCTTARFHWTPHENGWSLALAGLLSALVQGGLMRPAVRRLGEAAVIRAGLLVYILSYAVFGFATAGWMMYAGLFVNSLGNLVVPATQGLASNEVGPREQGKMQGALSSLTTACATIGTLAATALFARFNGPGAPIALPGAPFFLGIALYSIALGTALTLFRTRARG